MQKTLRCRPCTLLIGALIFIAFIARPHSAARAADSPWIDHAPMPTPRYIAATVLGPDHLIYTIGGFDASGRIVDTVEAYNPSTDTWSTKAPLPTPRYAEAAVTGHDGRIYVFGGDSTGTIATVDAYDPTTNTWAERAPMPAPRELMQAAVAPDGRIDVFAGTDIATYAAQAVTLVYSPATNAWTTGSTMPKPRWSYGLVQGPDGTVYTVGGASDVVGPTDIVESYSLATGTWADLPSLPTARVAPAVALGGDGKLYVVAGDAVNAQALAVVEAYDPATQTWTCSTKDTACPTAQQVLPPLPSPRMGMRAVTVPDGSIYVIGGTVSFFPDDKNRAAGQANQSYSPPVPASATPTSTALPSATPTAPSTPPATATNTPAPTDTPTPSPTPNPPLAVTFERLQTETPDHHTHSRFARGDTVLVRATYHAENVPAGASLALKLTTAARGTSSSPWVSKTRTTKHVAAASGTHTATVSSTIPATLSPAVRSVRLTVTLSIQGIVHTRSRVVSVSP